MSVESKIDDLTTLVQNQSNDIQSIKEVLAGDEFGNDGLVKQHKTLKEQFYKTREDVRKMKIIGGIVASVISFLIWLISIFDEV